MGGNSQTCSTHSRQNCGNLSTFSCPGKFSYHNLVFTTTTVWLLISADVKVEMVQDFLFSFFSCSKLSWCPPFLAGLVFQVFSYPFKRDDCLILGLISVSFSFIQPQNIFLPTPPVSILLSSLSNSLKQQTDLFTGHKSLRQKKVFTFCCVN